MKLSKGTLDILKNFSNINPSITFKEGQELSTLSIQKNILSRAVVEESFPKDFAIYDLQQFLSGVSLFENPELSFDNDSYVVIKDRNHSARYFFADPSTIVKPPENKVEISSREVTFVVAWAELNNLMKAAAIYGVEDLAVIGDGSDIKLVVRDKKNDTSNTYSVKVGQSTNTFTFNFKIEHLKLLPADYEVTMSKSNAALFKSTSKDLEYLIALEPDSVYNG